MLLFTNLEPNVIGPVKQFIRVTDLNTNLIIKLCIALMRTASLEGLIITFTQLKI